MAAEVHVRPEELAGLAAELSALAAELTDDAEGCRAAAAALSSALPGLEGWRAGGTARACAGLLATLSGNAAALAAVLGGVLASYRGVDASLAAGIGATARRGGAPR